MPSRSTAITPPRPVHSQPRPRPSPPTASAPFPSTQQSRPAPRPQAQSHSQPTSLPSSHSTNGAHPSPSARDARARLISNLNASSPSSDHNNDRYSTVTNARDSSNLTSIGGLLMVVSDSDDEYEEHEDRSKADSSPTANISPFSPASTTSSTLPPSSPPRDNVTVRTRARAGTVTRDAYVPPPVDLLSARSAAVHDTEQPSPTAQGVVSAEQQQQRSSPPRPTAALAHPPTGSSPPRPVANPPRPDAFGPARPPRPPPPQAGPPPNSLGLMPSPFPQSTPPLTTVPAFPATPPTYPNSTVPRLREPVRTPPSGPIYPSISAAPTQPGIRQPIRPALTIPQPLPPPNSPISPLLAAPPLSHPLVPPSMPFASAGGALRSPSESDNESIVGFETLREKKALFRGGEEELLTPFSPRVPGPRPRTRIGLGGRPDTVMDFWKRFSVSVKLDQKVGDSGWLKRERKPMWREPKFIIPFCIVILAIATIIFLAVFLPKVL